MPSKPRKTFTLPRLLVCEGIDDCRFFSRLVDQRGLPRFHIEDTAGENEKYGGRSKFGSKLKVLKQLRPGFAQLTSIVLVADNDVDQEAAFADIQRQLGAAGFAVPTAIQSRTVGKPAISVLMLPFANQPGNLELVCQDSARNADRAVAQHADTFCDLVNAALWSEDKRAKLWLRTNLASRFRSDPFVFLGNAFDEGLVPFNHKSFDPIAQALVALAP